MKPAAPLAAAVPTLALALALAIAGPAAAADDTPPAGDAAIHGELRLRVGGGAANAGGPLAAAHRLAPGLVAVPGDTRQLDLSLRGQRRIGPLQVAGDVLLARRQDAGRGDADASRVNELFASLDDATGGVTAGKKVVSWDVGYGFRPNDVVQQERRRSLYAEPLEGRPLLQWEHFDAERAWTLVWVNPQRLNAADDTSRGDGESALAARVYQRAGTADLYGFARVGAHTRGSIGAAVSTVVGESLELHASLRRMQRHDGWQLGAERADGGNPWAQALQGPATQALVGLQWTGRAQQSVLIEWWHDGTAPSGAAWRDWSQRNAALAALATLPARARAALLAWQTTPLDVPSLHRDNAFVRLAWQPDAWQASLDLLWQPEDGGRSVTAGLQWQGDRVTLNLALRCSGGPAGAVLAQVPQRRQALAVLRWAF